MKRILAAGVVIVCAWVAPADADWQYTRWGMTVDEVIAAAGKDAKIYRTPTPFELRAPHQLFLTGTYQTERYQFSAEFHFDDRGALRSISLPLLDKTKCPTLMSDMITIYGTPTISTNLKWEAVSWKDVSNNNFVSYEMSPANYCTLIYSDIIAPGATGGL